MASARNNRIQERRAALREQQKREREAADAAFKALDDELDAKIAAAKAVANVIELSGRERAAGLLGLEARELAAYAQLAKELAEPGADESADTSDADSADEGQGEAAAAGIPSQGEPATAAAAG
ncbi:hypothetical protein [Kitasatospora sp. NBC_01302]|uniref:hypothetical protein n=1 Tax=Kitasatospora sp. NBC_01302 TaxID=2903575 RepID=UPI002E1395A2|nr:hypothetical protein OG294_40860 [Kitasatospora sp. NBC_01302]